MPDENDTSVVTEQLSAQNHPDDIDRPQKMLVCFESGHYKKVTGKWKGDSLWTHWIKPDGKQVHINKEKVEYYEEI